MMIKLSHHRDTAVPESRIHEVVKGKAAEGGGFVVKFADGRGAIRCSSEPCFNSAVAAEPGLSVLDPYGEPADEFISWERLPIVGWSIDIGVLTGESWGALPLVTPEQAWCSEQQERLVIVDPGRRQARRWHDDLWRDDLAEVLGQALGTKVEVIGADPWSGPVTTRKAA
jgi:hypothetical protein